MTRESSRGSGVTQGKCKAAGAGVSEGEVGRPQGVDAYWVRDGERGALSFQSWVTSLRHRQTFFKRNKAGRTGMGRDLAWGDGHTLPGVGDVLSGCALVF